MGDTKIWTNNFRMNNRNLDYNPEKNRAELKRERHREQEEFREKQYRWHDGNHLNPKK